MDCVILKSSLNFFLIYITNVSKNVKKKTKKQKKHGTGGEKGQYCIEVLCVIHFFLLLSTFFFLANGVCQERQIKTR